MQKSLITGMFLAASTLSVAHAQYTDTDTQAANPTTASSQGVPAVRAYLDASSAGGHTIGRPVFDSQPSSGVFVRSDVANGVKVVSSSNLVTELRVLQGRADVTIHHPADHSKILVDLPGGQVSLLKDGLYTFNAGSKTVRVLHGEAEAFGATRNASKGTKVKEFQQLAFYDNVKLKAVNSYAYELTADLLPESGRGREEDIDDAQYRHGFYGGYHITPAPTAIPWDMALPRMAIPSGWVLDSATTAAASVASVDIDVKALCGMELR